MLIISDCMLVPVQGNLDVVTAPPLKSHLLELVDGGCKRIVLDMERADFIDSSGMAALLTVVRAARARGGSLTLVNASERVMHALSVGCLLPFVPCSAKRRALGPVPPLSAASTPLKRLTLRIMPENLEMARDRLRELFEGLPLDESEVFDMTLAAGEAMGNCVLHTPQGTGFLTVAVYQDRLVMEAVDNGPGFEIGEDEEPVVTLEHGRGIKIMRLLCDSVEIHAKPFGHGTVVRLVKLFGRSVNSLDAELRPILSA